MENTTKTRKESLHKEIVRSGNLTYFLDLRESEKGKLYLKISESRKKDEGYEYSSIFVFENSLDAFAEAVQKICAARSNAA